MLLVTHMPCSCTYEGLQSAYHQMQGLQRALEAGAKEVAVFAAASETFSRRNINCSIIDSLKRYQEVAQAAREASVRVRGYVSCALGCPYEARTPLHCIQRPTSAQSFPLVRLSLYFA